MMKQKLPKNWIVLGSKTHPDRVYYFNVKTNQSSWKIPTEDQSKQVTQKLVEPPKKRKKESGGQVKPTTPEHDVPEEEIRQRKRLTARRSLRQIHEKVNEEKTNKEKVNEEKETPQMQILREKILRRKEMTSPKSSKDCTSSKSSKNCTGPKSSKDCTSPKSPKTNSSSISKDNTKSSPTKSNKSGSSVHKSETDSSSNITYTPQMQAILEKMQKRISKHVATIKKVKGNKDSDIKSKEEKSAKLRQLRNKGAAVRNEAGKKVNEELDSIHVTRGNQNHKALKKNLGKDRMEKLRKSLTSSINNDDSLEEKLPSICKNAEVRLMSLKKKVLRDKISIDKRLQNDERKVKEKLSEGSTTTIDDLIQRSNDDSFCEEMDWEPLEDEKISFEVQAVRTQLCTENSTNTLPNIPSNIFKYPLLVEQHEKGQVYIVVDTNVFLSNIEIIDLVRETTFKTYDQPLIVIPWTVIRELDYIKDDNAKTKPASLCVKARKAVNYINKLFSSKHPRIIGQTPADVAKNKEKFSGDCPDDEILQTCLQIRDLGKSVVLLSYDINLCTKAMVHDIVTLGRNDPLEKIDYLNVVDYFNESSSSLAGQHGERLSLGSISFLGKEQCISDEMFEDIKSIIRDFLTVIVSKEMHALYGDCWEKYVIVKPPWTTVSVLQCAIKHWIAAVSESFSRRAEPILKELLQIFKDMSRKRTLQEISCILNKCNDLVQMVNIDKHADLISRVSKKVNELLERCHDYEFQINDQKLRDEIGVENNVEEQERRAQKAFQYFEAAYVYARDMCGLAAESVGMPCTFHYNTASPRPVLDYVKQIQPELAANINRLLCSLSAVMEQVKNSCIDYRTLNNLHQTLVTFLPETALTTSNTNNDTDLAPLDVYCCVKLKEEVLKTGLRQLQELSTHFCRLASYRCT